MVTSSSMVERLEDAGPDDRALADAAVDDLAAAADDARHARSTVAPRRTTPGSMVTSSAISTLGLDEGGGRVHERHAGAHVAPR